MSKIIKRQLRRSFPVVLILLILNISLVGVFFNLKFDLNRPAEKLAGWLEAVRADNASSTVTVRNAPPAFTVAPAENPTSSSTSPVNVGGSISFTATADDPENHSYYLLVCSSAAATPGAGGGPPTCNATQFCVSSLTGDTNPANCSYNNVTDPGAESRNWFALVCDNHATEPDCSNANQGSGDPGSPMYINHAPAISVVSTIDNFKDPGGIFTMRATSTDTDVQGGADVLTLYVCDTNSWATSTGCAGTTLCTGTSTSGTIDCQYTDTAPTPDQAYTYYAFVKDWHEMPASGNPQSSTYTINNVAPTVGAGTVTFNDGAVINLNMKNEATKDVWATSTSITDQNGCTDLSDATSTMFMINVAGGPGCSANDNNCYQVAAANCYISECSGAGDAIATIACRGSLAHYAVPTGVAGDNPYEPYNWQASINAYDEALTGTATSSGVEVFPGAALNVAEATIPYGILQAGQNSGAVNATTTVVNWGNVPIDTEIEGTWMTKGIDVITENNQLFDLANFTYPTATYTLSSTTAASVDVVVARPTNPTDVTDEVYWGIGIPVGIPSGDYTGVNTISAILDQAGGVWN